MLEKLLLVFGTYPQLPRSVPIRVLYTNGVRGAEVALKLFTELKIIAEHSIKFGTNPGQFGGGYDTLNEEKELCDLFAAAGKRERRVPNL